MSKKTIIILILIIILAGAGVFYFFINKTNSTPTTGNITDSGYQAFNPFGGGTKTNTQTTQNTAPTETPTPAKETTILTVASNFHKITDFSIAGATYFEYAKPIVATPVVIPPTTVITPATQAKTAAKTTTPKKSPIVKVVAPKFEMVPSLRYVEKATGHVYQMSLNTKEVGKVSNSTIPSIYEAIFDGTASSVIYRYLEDDGKTINSYLASFGGANGEFLPSNIVDLSISPDKTKFFYQIKNSSGIAGTIRSFNETKSNLVWRSSYTEWLSQWVSAQKIFLTTKASWSVNGNLFSMNTNNGILTKVFGGIPGLTTLVNGDGTLVLYNISTDTGPKLKIFNIKNRTTEDINIYGLPEKCTWSSDNVSIYCAIPGSITGAQYPDSWYQGTVSFDDYFVKINTSTNQTITLANSQEETPIDATHLFLDKTENQLFFINKKDYTLWSLDLI